MEARTGLKTAFEANGAQRMDLETVTVAFGLRGMEDMSASGKPDASRIASFE